MGGDRRATAGNVIVTDCVDKVLELDAMSLLAIAGVPATAFEMARVLQTSFEYYRRSQLQSLSLPAKVRALARLLRENLPMTMQGVGVVMPVFAGVDQTVSPPAPQIYFYDPLGAQFHAVGYAASGSGAGTIRSVLSFQDRYGRPRPAQMNLQQAIDAPMWHTNHFPRSFYPHDALPGSLFVEERIGAESVSELERRGHRVSVVGPWSQGRLSATAREPGRGLLLAAANPRGMQGYAIGR